MPIKIVLHVNNYLYIKNCKIIDSDLIDPTFMDNFEVRFYFHTYYIIVIQSKKCTTYEILLIFLYWK